MQDFFMGRGRTGRLNYFFMSIGIWVIAAIPLVMVSSTDPFTGELIIGPIGWMVIAIACWAGVANTIRRAHDINRRGWYVLLTWIPIVGLIIGLQLLFEPGTHGPNVHGIAAGTGTHDPKANQVAAEKIYAEQEAASVAGATEYYNDDGSFNMDGLFDNSGQK